MIYENVLDRYGNREMDLLSRKPIQKFTGKYQIAIPLKTERITCPCHNKRMSVLLSEGQIVNPYKECKRQRIKNGGKYSWEK